MISQHAEINVINKYYDIIRNIKDNVYLFVFKIDYRGRISNSKPCLRCGKTIDKIKYFDTIFWSINSGIEYINKKYLINLDLKKSRGQL